MTALVSCMHHHHLDCAQPWNWCEKQIEVRRTLAYHVHAKKLPNYPKIRFAVKSDTRDDLEIRKKGKEYFSLKIIERIMKKL